MALPIQLNHRPRAWRGDPLIIPLQCWRDRAKKLPLDLTRFGTAWTADVFFEKYQSAPVASFTLDVSGLASGAITLTLPDTATVALTRSNYLFRVRVTGGSVSPLTLFVGSFSVEG